MWHIDSVSLKISRFCVIHLWGARCGGVWRILREICQILFFIFFLFLSAFFLWRCDVNKDLLKICRPTHIIHMFYLLGLNSFWLPTTNIRKSWEKQQNISCTNICKSISRIDISRGIFSPARTFNLHNLQIIALDFARKRSTSAPPPLSLSLLL